MLERWYPWDWAPNVFAIDYAKLQALGYKGILFDIDNTLVHHGVDATPKVEALFRELDAMGMKTLLLSDNSAERIQRFNKHIGVPYIAEAGKPDPAAYRRGACRWSRSSASGTRCSGISGARTAAGWPAFWWISSACRRRPTTAKSGCWKSTSWPAGAEIRAGGTAWGISKNKRCNIPFKPKWVI